MAEEKESCKSDDLNDLGSKMERVFGRFDDFYNCISAQGSSVKKHGVTAYELPATPVVPRKAELALADDLTESSVQQATRECLQKMQELVTNPPLQIISRLCKPSIPADSLNHSHGPSSSTSDFKSKKRKDRSAEGEIDTEVEKKRRRDRDRDHADEDIRPSTSNSNNQNSMRELFGDDNEEIEKATVSPDSGVHSTENDVGDDGDIYSAQTILNIITRLSPPLSPLPDRPLSRRKIEEENDAEEKNKSKSTSEQDTSSLKPPTMSSDNNDTDRKKKEPKEKPEKVEKSEKPEKVERLEKQEKKEKRDKLKRERDSKDKLSKEAPEKKRDKVEKKESSRSLDKGKEREKDRSDRSERSERSDRPDKIEKSDKAEKLERPDRSDRPEKSQARTHDRNERVERLERSERPERPERVERQERTERLDRTERPERTDRPERTERIERTERPERTDRPDRPERPERPDRPDRNERPERPDRPERSERPEKLDRVEKPDKSEKVERPEKSERAEKLEKAEKPERTEKPEKVEKPERSEKPDRSEKSDRLEKPDRSEKLDRLDKTEKVEKIERSEKADRPEKSDRSDKDRIGSQILKSKSEKKQKDDDNRSDPKIIVNAPSPVINGVDNRLKGEINLFGLSPDQMTKLADLGKKYGTVEEGSSPVPPVAESNERRRKHKDRRDEKDDPERKRERKEVRSDKVADRPRERDIKSEASRSIGQSTPSPRPGSSQSVIKEFRCACNECMPTKSTKYEKHPSDVKPSEFYQNLARDRKRKADHENDRVLRILLYLESTVYFGISAQHMETEESSQRHVSVLRDTSELLKVASHNFATKETLSPLEKHFVSRVKNLSLRAQSVLSYNLYRIKTNQVLKSFYALEKMEAEVRYIPKMPDLSNPETYLNESPSSTSAANAEGVLIPINHYNCLRAQFKTFQYIMFAHKFWEDAATMTTKNTTDINFVNSLESVCGHYCMESSMDKYGIFLLTAVMWLRNEYDLEKKRPPPAADRRT